jgi:hypothetical protein
VEEDGVSPFEFELLFQAERQEAEDQAQSKGQGHQGKSNNGENIVCNTTISTIAAIVAKKSRPRKLVTSNGRKYDARIKKASCKRLPPSNFV